MATSRQHGNRWEFCIRRKGIIPKPIYLSFPTKEEGEIYCARIEKLLDSGVVPDELLEKARPLTTISQAYEQYQLKVPLSQADESYWPILLRR